MVWTVIAFEEKEAFVYITKNHIEESYLKLFGSGTPNPCIVLQLTTTFIRYTSNIFRIEGSIIIIEATLDFSNKFVSLCS